MSEVSQCRSSSLTVDCRALLLLLLLLPSTRHAARRLWTVAESVQYSFIANAANRMQSTLKLCYMLKLQ